MVLDKNLEFSFSKECHHCGRLYYRDKRCTWSHWRSSKFCSRACASRYGGKIRTLSVGSLKEEFWKRVDKGDECWIWNGAKDKDGYGRLTHLGKSYRANRVSLMLAGREVPEGFYACHTCDNPACVNPEHLYGGTPKQNSKDASDRGRACRGEKVHFAKLTENDVVNIRKDSRPLSEIAEQYGVSKSSIRLIMKRKTWRHIP